MLDAPTAWQELFTDRQFAPGVEIEEDRGRTSTDASTDTVVDEQTERFTLRVAIEGEGYTEPPPGPLSLPAGSVVVVRAIPAEGNWFSGWEGDVQAHDLVATVVLDDNKTLRAVFRSSRSPSVPQFHVPWSVGETFRLSQGNGGSFSHQELFAWDIPMPVGTPVVASGSGVVVDLRDSASESIESRNNISEQANFVTIDHGHGLKSIYAHLAFRGATVTVGQRVAAGQVIGHSGNTGFSTSPHLHYEVRDDSDRSVSTGFFESYRMEGIAQVGDELTSQNVLDTTSPNGLQLSTMPRDAFAINGIELLDDSVPAYLFDTETVYEIRGRVLDGRRRVCAALVDTESLETVFCDLTPVDEHGEFTILFRIPPQMTGQYWFGVISGDGGANGMAPRTIRVVPRLGDL